MGTFSLKAKFIIIAISIELIGFGVAAFLSCKWMARTFERHYTEEARIIRTHVFKDIESAMLSKNHQEIPKILNTYRTHKGVEEVRVFDPKGQEAFTENKGYFEEKVAEGLKTGMPTSFGKEIHGKQVISFITSIQNKPECHRCHGSGERIRGALLLSLSLEEMNQGISQHRMRLLLLFTIVAILVSTVTILSVNRLFINPLKRIQEGAEAVGKGQFKYQIPLTSRDEIGELARTFNQMSEQLTEAFESVRKSQQKIVEAEKLAALGQLSAGLAHELKNPLTSIKMILQAMLDSVSPPEMTTQDIEVILKEVKRLDTILTQFLTFAKPSGLHLRPLNLRETVEEVLSLMKTRFDRSDVKVLKEIAEDLPSIAGDQEKMRQVLINLFLNSVQAMPDGGRLSIVAGKMSKNNHKEVFLKVEDTGYGIEEENQEKVFDPFFTTKEHGTGLGLSIVYSIVKEHRGKIDLQSRVGKGTSFTLTFLADG